MNSIYHHCLLISRNSILFLSFLLALTSCEDDHPSLNTGTLITVSGNQNGTYIADAGFRYIVSSGTNGWNGTYLDLGIACHKASGPQINLIIYKLKDTSGIDLGISHTYLDFTGLPSLQFRIDVRSSLSRNGPDYYYQINEDNPGINWIKLTRIDAENMKGELEFNLESRDGEKLKIVGFFNAIGNAYWFDP